MITYFLFFFVVYLLIEIGYFRIAEQNRITDKPNHRSSHSGIVIRGGGIIFPVAFVLPFFFYSFYHSYYLVTGLLCISTISFVDDLINLKSFVRLPGHFIAIGFLVLSLQTELHPLLVLVLFIALAGVINVYNFMDGINGITAMYSVTAVITLFWISKNIAYILPDMYFISLLASLLVFSVFNVRKTAKCFAGDVGSIGMAFILCYMIIVLIIATKSVLWFFLLSVYGIDTVCTIIFRISRGENIFTAHRSHFYQFLANEWKVSHIKISTIYIFLQIILNLSIIWSYSSENLLPVALTLSAFILLYLVIRFRFEGRSRLLTAY